MSSANEVLLLARICDNIHKELPARGVHLSLGIQGFYWGSVVEACNACMTDFSYSDSGPPEQRQFIVNPIVSIYCPIVILSHGPWPQAPKNPLIT